MCYYPTIIKNKKYEPNQKNGGYIDWDAMLRPDFDKRVLAVPVGCGKCIECRKQRAREWQVRLLEDVRHNKNGKFITLTFSNESITKLATEVTQKKTKIITGEKQYIDKNGKLRKRYTYKTLTEEIELRGYETDNAIATLGVRKFLERWRKKHKKSLRHWFITELGHKGTENIHMHGIVWTDEEVNEIASKWDYGYIYIGQKKDNGKIENYVTEKTVNYITKYVSKMDFDHREYKSKVLTSGGIGKGYMDRTDWERNIYQGEETKETYTTRTGHEMALPVYYRNKIYTEEEREKLWIIKLNKEVRYVDKKKISTKQGDELYYKALETARQKNARLGYGSNTTDWNRKKYEEQRRNLMIQKRITAIEEKKSLRGLPVAGEPESVNSSPETARWEQNIWLKRDIGWDEDEIIFGK